MDIGSYWRKVATTTWAAHTDTWDMSVYWSPDRDVWEWEVTHGDDRKSGRRLTLAVAQVAAEGELTKLIRKAQK